MAKREMPPSRRQHRVILEQRKAGAYTTSNPEGQMAVFREYQRFGKIPAYFDSPAHLKAVVDQMKLDGFTIQQIRETLGMDSKLQDNGSLYGRAIRDASSPMLDAAVDERSGPGTAARINKAGTRTWNLSSKENAEFMRELGLTHNNGHVNTSANNNDSTGTAQANEVAADNQRAKDTPRPIPNYQVSRLGITTSKGDGAWEGQLAAEGIPTGGGRLVQPLTPAVGYLAGTQFKDGEIKQHLNPRTIEMLNYAAQDLEAQGAGPREMAAMAEHVAAGGRVNKASLTNAAFNTEPSFKNGTHSTGPAKVIQNGVRTENYGSHVRRVAKERLNGSKPTPKPPPPAKPPAKPAAAKPAAKPPAKPPAKPAAAKPAAKPTARKPAPVPASARRQNSRPVSPMEQIGNFISRIGSIEKNTNAVLGDFPGMTPTMAAFRLAD